ncbi:excalibur calcium-binding domain-containing protein [Microbacterium sp. 1P06AB]|uniref:excalibur calcium-binding domain-containing protein n=1 Tax=Microbacterium sp. 1P06AB TaxID=3132289 RepID=UPI0039A56151
MLWWARPRWRPRHPCRRHPSARREWLRRRSPTFSTALYNANSKMDRDKDGIACE